MKCMIQERNEIIPDEEYTIWVKDQVGNVRRLSAKCLGEREVCFYRERLDKMRENNRAELYIEKHEA